MVYFFKLRYQTTQNIGHKFFIVTHYSVIKVETFSFCFFYSFELVLILCIFIQRFSCSSASVMLVLVLIPYLKKMRPLRFKLWASCMSKG